ncbi:hypothetical protein Fmac_027448 [Flemingia macrophylla]|uniref:Pentatricopeptide repeat-containing protein n=1 Tax=Flemingia macrophylla TaxID=520843 RepID=A0ABD1LHR6_9FABA
MGALLEVELALRVFDERPVKDLIACNAMISGHGGSVFEVYSEMKLSGVLTAIMGLIGRWRMRWSSVPDLEHCSCVVDLLPRVGRLEEAMNLIKSMKVKPDGAVWGVLWNACKIYKNVEVAVLALKHVVELEPMNIVRVMMREGKLRRDPGCSRVECKGKMQLFYSGGMIHHQSKDIHRMVDSESLVNEIRPPDENYEGRNEGLFNWCTVSEMPLTSAITETVSALARSTGKTMKQYFCDFMIPDLTYVIVVVG